MSRLPLSCCLREVCRRTLTRSRGLTRRGATTSWHQKGTSVTTRDHCLFIFNLAVLYESITMGCAGFRSKEKGAWDTVRVIPDLNSATTTQIFSFHAWELFARSKVGGASGASHLCARHLSLLLNWYGILINQDLNDKDTLLITTPCLLIQEGQNIS